MATIPLDLALETLASLVAQEFRLLGGLSEAVSALRHDLDSMRALLQDAQNQSQSNHAFKTLLKQVRDVAYDAEDAVDEFFITLTLPTAQGFTHSFLNFFRSISGLRAQHRLAVQIESIKLRIEDISRRRKAFSIEGPSSSSSSTQLGFDPRQSALYIDEADVVGIENPRSTLTEWLVKGKEKLTCVSVVGMGGVGKTTLVKKVFDSHIVKTRFDCHSWVTVSKSFNFLELLQVMFKGFMGAIKVPSYKNIEIEQMSESQLVESLRNYLQKKRYVVVLDDIWSIDAWETVKVALLDCNCNSRIIVTTRFIEVAASMETAGHIYQLDPLQEKEAWTLFCSKTFRGDHGGVCPPELERLSHAFLKKCGGLPLAIVAIGGLLSKRSKVVPEWKKILDSLATEIGADGKLNNLEKILLLSYNDLPHHLKTCYLYMSAFPEDYAIKRMKLVRLWVTERFVEEKQGLTLEQVAESYLNELVNRSLIQVMKMDHFNRVNTCQLHDIMREVLLVRSKEDSLIVSMNQTNMPKNENVRRMSIHDNFENLPLYMQFKKVSTLLTFNLTETSTSKSVGSSSFQGSRVLRVLELENAPLDEFPKSIVKLVFLRYLSLRRTPISIIPDSIKNLKNLEILDLKFSLVSSLPSGILELKRLQQLRCYHYTRGSSQYFSETRGMAVPTGIGKLTSLQKLGSVEVDNEGKLVGELGKLTQLRRLGILKLREEHATDFCYTFERLKNLTGLYMVSINMDETLQLNREICPPGFLQRLFVKCRLPAFPRWITSLQYLEKLVLENSRMKEDPLEALQALPSLVMLELRDAYDGKKLQCGGSGYPRLKKLGVHMLNDLTFMKVAEGAMPELRELVITACSKLETVPLGIEHLKNLNILHLRRMTFRFLKKIESSNGEDFWRVQHIPVITGLPVTKKPKPVGSTVMH